MPSAQCQMRYSNLKTLKVFQWKHRPPLCCSLGGLQFRRQRVIKVPIPLPISTSMSISVLPYPQNWICHLLTRHEVRSAVPNIRVSLCLDTSRMIVERHNIKQNGLGFVRMPMRMPISKESAQIPSLTYLGTIEQTHRVLVFRNVQNSLDGLIGVVTKEVREVENAGPLQIVRQKAKQKILKVKWRIASRQITLIYSIVDAYRSLSTMKSSEPQFAVCGTSSF